MSKSKLGPIPDDHFENDPSPPGTYAGRASPESKARIDAETERLKREIQSERSGAKPDKAG